MCSPIQTGDEAITVVKACANIEFQRVPRLFAGRLQIRGRSRLFRNSAGTREELGAAALIHDSGNRSIDLPTCSTVSNSFRALQSSPS
jgi:hypothetical protein